MAELAHERPEGSEPRRPDRSDLPTGTVTFLFTDIEGSTRLVQRLGDSYPELLATHDATMRRAIEEHGGVEVSTEGDAFFAVFASPQAAVMGAVAAQRAQAACAWPADAVVRVRMGLHSGQGLLGGDNYVGVDVNRAARVAAAAHGGQVLVSDATRALLEGSALPGIGLKDLGAYRLKDLDEPMRLHQLTVEGLPAEFPPPRATRLGTLPTPRTSFVGRREVLDELRTQLRATRLLVLTGPGGAGKTRLSLELARTVVDEFPDGAFFVPLETLTDARLVPSTVLEALDVPPGSRPADDALRDLLAAKQILLVLDNLEQIPDAAAVIDALLQAAPGLKIVVTSRIALRIYGEQEYPVPPLALPEASTPGQPGAMAGYEGVALFVERARSTRPDFRLTDANAAAVADICRRLDGLPLAVELAAARIRMLAPDAILARLDRRLRLLEDRAPNLPPRQRSMRGAIEWSYALLGDGERRLLDRLSIFAGGWDLPAAEAVCEADEIGMDVLDGIGSLLDKSLVHAQAESAEPRFGMLQTIQEYGRERLSVSGQVEAVARRHAEYFRGVVEAAEPEFVGADPQACLARIVPDQDNMRAALDWSLATDAADVGLAIGAAVWRLWQLRGQLSEGRRYLDALLALPSAAEPSALRARALVAAGGVAYWQGDPASETYYREALSICESLGDEAGVAESYSNLGFVYLTAKPPAPEEAERHFVESLRRYESLGDERMVASLTGSLGFSKMGQGRIEEARADLERALELNLAGGYRGRAADNRFALGNIYRKLGRFDDSAGMYRAALAETLEMHDAARKLIFLNAIASWATDMGRLPEAVRLIGAVRREAREQGGSLGAAPGLVDPEAAAREAGLDEELIASELAAGERLNLDQMVAFAFGLLGARPD